MDLSAGREWFWPTPEAQAEGAVCDRCGRRLGGLPPTLGQERVWRHPREENPYHEGPLPGGDRWGNTCAQCWWEDVLRRRGPTGGFRGWGVDVVDRAAIAGGVRGTVTSLDYWEDPKFLGTHARVRFLVTVGVDRVGQIVAVPIHLGMSPSIARGLLYDGDVVEIQGFDARGKMVRTASVTNIRTGKTVDNWSPDNDFRLDNLFRESTRRRG